MFYKVCCGSIHCGVELHTSPWLQESVEAVGDVTLDLVDYCHQCVTWLIAKYVLPQCSVYSAPLYCSHETVPVEQQTTDDTLQVIGVKFYGTSSSV